ncbi:MAG: hypothetical protein V1881_03335 [Candidatus Micrarchaeota archaeon]
MGEQMRAFMTTIVAALVTVSFASLAGLTLGISGGKDFSLVSTEAQDNAFAFEDAAAFYSRAFDDCAADAAYASWGCSMESTFCGYFGANLAAYLENATKRLNANSTHEIAYVLEGASSCEEVSSGEKGAAYHVSATISMGASSKNAIKNGMMVRTLDAEATRDDEGVFRMALTEGENAVAGYAVRCPTPTPPPIP